MAEMYHLLLRINLTKFIIYEIGTKNQSYLFSTKFLYNNII